MTDLPAPLLSALDTYAARARVLTATDFDGVLAPLVDRPSDSRPLPGSIDVLTTLSGLPGTTAAVVSGRDLESLRLVTGLGPGSPVVLIGSHGAEASQDLGLGTTMDAAAHARLGAATTYVEDIVAGHPDTRIERKPAGVVLHTRRVDEAQAASATAAALRIPDADPGIHAMRGKDVVELSVLTVTKGLALQALAESSASESVLYLGDDVTDEKAFAVLQQDHHVTVKVGDGPTCARYRVPAPDAAVAVLRAVLDRRRG